MTSEPFSHNRVPHHADEAYWTALFEQEETLSSPVNPELEKEEWSVSRRVDSRFRWSDGGKSMQEDPWQVAQEFLESDQNLELLVTAFNKGGLIVHWNGLQGFVPASQLIDFPQFHVERQRVHALRQWLGRSLNLKVIEVNQKLNRLIFSERAALVEAKERDQLLHWLRPGNRIEGEVTNLTDFGVFVDLGGVEGLIHISELSWSRVIHPSEILQPGQRLIVLVLNVDRNNGRVALSLKQLKRDPWRNIEQRYKPGQIVEGMVNNVVNFGAFVLLEDELEGLIHISELAEGSFLHPRNVVRKGETVSARVLHVDGPNKRLALSLRGISQNSHAG